MVVLCLEVQQKGMVITIMKRGLALLLSAAMALSLLASVTWAAEDDKNAEKPAQETSNASTVLLFGDLKKRMLSGCQSILVLEKNIAVIESINYDDLEEEMRDQMNATVAQQAMMEAVSGQTAVFDPAVTGLAMLTGTMMGMSLNQQYEAYKDAYESIRDGEMQKDNAEMVRQLRNAENTAVMMGETLYITLLSLQTQDKALTRNGESLDRTIRELKLRYELGQISALTLRQAEAGKPQLVSGQETLRMNVGMLRRQLNAMIGQPLTGELRLQQLPEVTDAQLAAMDADKDLEKAKAASYELYTAKKTLDDADEEYRDQMDKYRDKNDYYKKTQAQYTWEAAQHTYRSTVETFELNFRKLFDQVKDYAQILTAAKTALACEQANRDAAKVRYELGTISHNALLDAEDKVYTAENKVQSAKYDLFTAYNNYCWAVNEGIVNG